MKELLLKVINGELKSIEIPFQKLQFYIDILSSLGLKQIDFDQNGWQLDFSMYFQFDKDSDFDKNDNLYCITGSFRYSDNFIFKITNEDN
jgi:hypothetical protein